MGQMQERRKFVRLNHLVDVIYQKLIQHPLQEKITITRNISKGGICIIAYEALPQETILDLKIFLPEDQSPVLAKGRVAWIKEFIVGDVSKGRRYDVGVEFIDISDYDILKIGKFIFSYLKA